MVVVTKIRRHDVKSEYNLESSEIKKLRCAKDLCFRACTGTHPIRVPIRLAGALL